MGSAPSSTSLVSSIDERQEKVRRDGDDEREEEEELESRVSELEGELSASRQRCLEVEARYSQATDELELLREELERLNRQLADSRASSASERATKLLVRRLEMDLLTAKQEVLDMKDQHDQQMKRVRATSAKSQAESSLTVFELRDENHQLSKENSKLREQVRWCQREHTALSQGPPPVSITTNSSSSLLLQGHDSHDQLVIELSQQVASLSGELEQARLTISELQAEMNP